MIDLLIFGFLFSTFVLNIYILENVKLKPLLYKIISIYLVINFYTILSYAIMYSGS